MLSRDHERLEWTSRVLLTTDTWTEMAERHHAASIRGNRRLQANRAPMVSKTV